MPGLSHWLHVPSKNLPGLNLLRVMIVEPRHNFRGRLQVCLLERDVRPSNSFCLALAPLAHFIMVEQLLYSAQDVSIYPLIPTHPQQGNGGIVVNGLFEAVNGVYAAGSAASFFDPVMGRRRIGSHDHCVNSGLYAGEGTCGVFY